MEEGRIGTSGGRNKRDQWTRKEDGRWKRKKRRWWRWRKRRKRTGEDSGGATEATANDSSDSVQYQLLEGDSMLPARRGHMVDCTMGYCAINQTTYG